MSDQFFQVRVSMDQIDPNLSKSALCGKTLNVNIKALNEKTNFEDVNTLFYH